MTEKLQLIGSWKYPEKSFVYEKRVLIKQTNFLGNVYFSNHIEWQGEARESFFLCHPAAGAFLQENPHLLLITQALQHRFLSNAFFGDLIRIRITSKDIRPFSLVIVFNYTNAATGEKVGEGWQKICFFDQQKNAPCKIPQFILDLALSVKED